jgi:uncharacterized protein involved in tolerance to divalent cations
LQENDKPVLIYSTFPSVAEAERIGGDPYTNPALLALPVSDGSEDFMRWIAEQTGKPT